MVEIELDRLKLDPDNPRLPSAYLTHALPSRPNEEQIIQVLVGLPEFQALLDAISRNHGCFQPPLITVDCRVLEGNRRVTALRKLRTEDPQNRRWEVVPVHQLTARYAGAGTGLAREIPFGARTGLGWLEPTHRVCGDG